MAEEHLKYLTARLTLDTSDLDKAKAKIGAVAQETERASQAADPATSRYQRMSKAVEDVGKVGDRLTVGVTLPMVALGVAAGSADRQFETTFTRMQTLAGVSADEVDGLKASVKSLAVDTAQDTQQVAEGLYFIRSAGLEGAAAMDALKVSAQGAAVGLGDSASVADTVTSAMLAYGPAVLSAAKAGDVLVASARAGKVEASELGPQMGRLLPLATSLGIGFDQLGAGMAFLSRQSGDASLAATQLSGVMSKLLKPSQQAEETLAAVGLSMDDVRKVASEQGLPAALQLVSDRLGGNQQKLGAVFEDVQALQGAMIFLNSDAKQLGQVFDDVKNSTGALGDAFATTAQTDAFKQQQAMAELKNAMIDLGQALGPIISSVAGGIGSLARAFSALPGPVKDAMTYAGLFVAALGPIMSAGSRVVETVRTIRTALDSVKAAGAGASAAMAAVAIAMAGATVAYAANAADKAKAKAVTDDFVAALQEEAKGQQGAMAAAMARRIQATALQDAIDNETISVKQLAAIIKGDEAPSRELLAKLTWEQQAALKGLTAGYADSTEIVRELSSNTAELGGATGATTEVIRDASDALGEHTSAQQTMVGYQPTATAALKPPIENWQKLAEKIKAATQATFDDIDAGLAYEDAVNGSQDALAAYTKLVDEHGNAKRRGAKAAEEAERAELAAEKAIVSQSKAAGEAALAQSLFKDEQSKAVAAAQAQAAEFEKVAATLGPDSPLAKNLLEYARKLRDDIPRTIVTEIGLRILPTGNEKIDRNIRGIGARKTGGDVPGAPDEPVPMLLHGGEFVLSRDVVDAIKRGGPTLGMGPSVERLMSGGNSTSVSTTSTTHAPQYVVNVVNHPERPWYEADAARELNRLAVLGS